jgi:C4-dicarboxylate transporter, DctQ subunit
MSEAGRIVRRILELHDAVSLRISWAGAAALGLIVAIYSYEVTMRYLLGAPTRWANDFVAFLLLISVFSYLPWLTREGGNIAVTLLPDLLSERAGQWILRTGFLISAGVCLWATWIGVQETERLFQRNTMTLTTVRLPKWAFLALIVYGLGNSGLYFLRLAMSPGAQQTSRADA